MLQRLALVVQVLAGLASCRPSTALCTLCVVTAR